MEILRSAAFILLVLLSACTDDKSDFSAAGDTGLAPISLTLVLYADHVLQGGDDAASGSGSFSLAADNALQGELVLASGFSTSQVSLRSGFAGESGSLVATLESQGAGVWRLPASLVLSPLQRQAAEQGGLHIRVDSSAYPNGASRGQLLPAEFRVYRFRLDDTQVVPPSQSAGSAIGFATLDLASQALEVHVQLSNVSASGMALASALAGLAGADLYALQQDNTNISHWLLPRQALDQTAWDDLMAAGLYVEMRSVLFPDGELRGQIVPEGFVVDFVALSGSEAVSGGSVGVTTTGNAIAAATLDLNSRELTVHLNIANLPAASAASLNLAVAGFNGPPEANLAMDLVNSSLWSIVEFAFTPAVLSMIEAQATYFVVATPTWPDGELRGQWRFIPPEMGQAPPPVNPAATLSAIQSSIFTPRCTGGCHNGAAPAAGQNLESGQAFSNIVGVTSTQKPALLRVAPGDPGNSYLLQKIEGAAGISGFRMPLGGPALSSSQIQSVREWIAEGALNN